MLAKLIRRRLRRYRGAGILFYRQCGGGEAQFLLGQRRRGGRWTVPGGGMETRDHGDYWRCACREVEEEFGPLPMPQPAASLYLSVGIRSWTTFIVPLPAEAAGFPNASARDYGLEFSTHRWFALNGSAADWPRMDIWIYPAVWRLRRLLAHRP